MLYVLLLWLCCSEAAHRATVVTSCQSLELQQAQCKEQQLYSTVEQAGESLALQLSGLPSKPQPADVQNSRSSS
jgi:hypothetical protein